MSMRIISITLLFVISAVSISFAAPATDYTFVREFGQSGIQSNRFYAMDGIAVDRFGSVFVSDVQLYFIATDLYSTNQAVKRWTTEGQFDLSWVNHYGFSSMQGPARGIDCSCDGDPYYIAPSVRSMEANIEYTSPSGIFFGEFPDSSKSHYRDVAVCADGAVYAVQGEGAEYKRIVKFVHTGTNWIIAAAVGVVEEGGLSDHAYAIDADAWRGRVYVTVLSTATGAAGVKVYDLDLNGLGNLALWPGTARPTGIAVDNRDGSFLVTETETDMIYKYTSDGMLILSFGMTGSGHYEFNDPSDLDIDMAGWLYVADAGNHRVQVYAPPRAGNLNFIVYKSKVKVGWKQKLKGKDRDIVLCKAYAAIDVYTNITSMVGMPFSFWCSDLVVIPEMLPTKTNKKGTKALYAPDKDHKAIVQYRPEGALLRITVKLKRGAIDVPLNITDTTPLPPWLWLTAQMTLSSEYLGIHYMRLEHMNKTGKVYKAWKK